MLKQTMTYTDYNGVERTEDFYFNLTKAEILEMQLTTTGGLDVMIQKIIDTKDVPTLTKLFKEIILKAYGKKSDDGRRFIKSKEITDEFEQTEAYSELFTSLLSDDVKAAAFIKGIVPQQK